MPVHVLTRLDAHEIPSVPSEVRVFCAVKDEMLRLPYFLTHHRNLGVARFFFIDNGSIDGTTQFLLSQEDCHVFHTTDAYKTGHIAWGNALLDLYGTGYWCLRLDADELLIYPHCERTGVRAFCDFLEKEGSETIFTFMLDLYPDGNVAHAKPAPDEPWYEICPYFDRDYTFVKRIGLRGPPPFPPNEVIGGPRTRCFYRSQGENSFARRLFMHVVERGIHNLREHGINVPYIRLKATPLFKVPLIKWKKGLAYTASSHHTNAAVRLSEVSGVLLHSKFLSDFYGRVVTAVATSAYAQDSIEYKRYLKQMDSAKHLMYEGSLKYTSSDDVLNARLMNSTTEFDEFCRHRGHTQVRLTDWGKRLAG